MASFSLHHGEGWEWLRGLASESADALVTDPPYSSGGFTRGDRTSDPAEKYRASGAKETTESFSGDNRDQRSMLLWCSLWLTEAHRVLRDGASIVVATDWRQLPTVTDAIQIGGFVWRGIATWTKKGASRPQRGRFRADAEFFVWGSKGAMPIEGSALPGTFHPPAPTIDVAPVNPHARLHLTEKPVEVMEAVLEIPFYAAEGAVSMIPPGKLCLDPFTGSGSTGVACLRRGVDFSGCELSAHYHELALRRLEAEASGFDGTTSARTGQLTIGGPPR